jgi:hypothetical protein
MRLRLGVNIDHVATIRNARGGDHPDPVRAAQIVAACGGDGITAHLREDRRHIRDDDLARIQAATDLPLNLEMAATEEMLEIALRHRPHGVRSVPPRAGSTPRVSTTASRRSSRGWPMPASASACSSPPRSARSKPRCACARRWSNYTPANTPMRKGMQWRTNCAA